MMATVFGIFFVFLVFLVFFIRHFVMAVAAAFFLFHFFVVVGISVTGQASCCCAEQHTLAVAAQGSGQHRTGRCTDNRGFGLIDVPRACTAVLGNTNAADISATAQYFLYEVMLGLLLLGHFSSYILQ